VCELDRITSICWSHRSLNVSSTNYRFHLPMKLLDFDCIVCRRFYSVEYNHLGLILFVIPSELLLSRGQNSDFIPEGSNEIQPRSARSPRSASNFIFPVFIFILSFCLSSVYLRHSNRKCSTVSFPNPHSQAGLADFSNL